MRNLTPEHMRCHIAECPAVYELPEPDSRLLIIGSNTNTIAKWMNDKKIKVGANESAVLVERALLANACPLFALWIDVAGEFEAPWLRRYIIPALGRAMAKNNATTIIRPTDKDIDERFRRDLARDVQHAVHAKRATLKLLQLKIYGLIRRFPS